MDRVAPTGPVYQAGTLSGNPLAVAAGLATLRRIEKENPYPELEALGCKVRAGFGGPAGSGESRGIDVYCFLY